MDEAGRQGREKEACACVCVCVLTVADGVWLGATRRRASLISYFSSCLALLLSSFFELVLSSSVHRPPFSPSSRLLFFILPDAAFNAVRTHS